ncbi:hypothetical protein HDV64DRAFT_246042 [Trichoderma sp. TUCIM 5745]
MGLIVDPPGASLNLSMDGKQSSDQPERQVFLREGTIVLRWLFGYYNKRCLPDEAVPYAGHTRYPPGHPEGRRRSLETRLW